MSTPPESVRPDGLRTPHPDRLPKDLPQYSEIMERHARACAEDEMGYTDPVSGLFAMTAEYLSQRPCCSRGCRHCPYVL